MSTESIECAHAACNCVVSAPVGESSGEPLPAYCTDFCRDAAENREEEQRCDCGHPPCDSP